MGSALDEGEGEGGGRGGGKVTYWYRTLDINRG